MQRWGGITEGTSVATCDHVSAMTYLRTLPTSCRPVEFICGNFRHYFTKGRENGERLIKEHIVGQVGATLGAPVPRVAVVDVSQELIEMEPQLRHFDPGEAHGSETIPGCFDSRNYQYTVDGNRVRFAKLALLYGLVGATDVQFLYEKTPPHRVWSVDHGQFFWPSDNGTIVAAPFASTVEGAGLTRLELRGVAGTLRSLVDARIVEIVNGVPGSWGFPLEARVQTAQFLASQRDILLSSLENP
jgi:hypothetical protein